VKIYLLVSALVLATTGLLAQDRTNSKFGKGINVLALDSSFSLKFSVRVQSLYQGQYDMDDREYSDGFQIRRSRLKFDGFAYHPSFQYKIELAIANADINSGSVPQSGNTSNIILDAYVKWNFYKRWSVWFGQAKLPGNRERVISSQALQFVDRSNVNGRFNLDRDAGLQIHYNAPKFNFISSISMGEGRNIIVSNIGGYDYTFRTELLPFGQFESKGDYFSSDLKREETPKLSIGITYDYNDRASRERGQLGDFFESQRDLSTWFIDAHFKYQGFSSLIEYANRRSPDGAVILADDGTLVDAFYTGSGISLQAGYLFKSDLEVAGRYTAVTPGEDTFRNDNWQYTLGFSKYFVEHSLKVQTDISLNKEDTRTDVFMYRLQLEVAL
jgi:phosphate-selective porin OprO and OprP